MTGVPTRTSLRSARTSPFRSRTQPCETACPINHGLLVPWTPTTRRPASRRASSSRSSRTRTLPGSGIASARTATGRRTARSASPSPRPDRDRAGAAQGAVDVELELPRLPVDDEPAVDRLHVRRGRRDPAGTAVRPAGDRDAIPRRLTDAIEPRVDCQHRARMEVGPELGECREDARVAGGRARTATFAHAIGPAEDLHAREGRERRLPSRPRERREQRPGEHDERQREPADVLSRVGLTPRPRRNRLGRRVLPRSRAAADYRRIAGRRPRVEPGSTGRMPRGSQLLPRNGRPERAADAHPRAARVRESVPHRRFPSRQPRTPRHSEGIGAS